MPVNNLFQSIFTAADASAFNAIAGRIFSYQVNNNPVYSQFAGLLGNRHAGLQAGNPDYFPLLPVSAFKQHDVICNGLTWQTVFTSSTTTGGVPSRHLVHNPVMYRTTYLNAFKKFYGNPSDWCILALLPSYLERDGSSLIDMCKGLMEESGHTLNGFFLNDTSELMYRIRECGKAGQRVWLIGVTFALIELALTYKEPMQHVTVIETGGMKGRGKEMIRAELHSLFKQSWNNPPVHSEYGMTEMFSQCYALHDGKFSCPPWVRVVGRQPEDVLSPAKPGQTCVLGVIDLANVTTCSFLLTGDLGRVYADGTFEVTGRMDNAEIRGCNLMGL